MVNASSIVLVALQSTESALEQLDPPRRIAVLMALLGLILVGLMLVMIVMVGAKWVRRLARHEVGQHASGVSGYQRRSGRLQDGAPDIMSEVNTGETIRLNVSSKETKMEP